ncbi:DNA 5'-adenosine monophosphate hydrolase [Trametes versicolor FP-101664 SS1]|uniref:Aprataxin C2HE/C2H2/C2HC zinc finger domain-containing protein n=1 Tax=Trametes versicolor (strain FP-101664) TaxID=717944 RepID=R7S6W4_TRAVS|nr:DNA 5'-adenosine monophosphate hydrolase [Trametes versicolor FP-101664 SS1]EIW51723.1 hypothetical protein TRAVEDRAFT_136817 [Trametes versicolor FP-101664 SS1]
MPSPGGSYSQLRTYAMMDPLKIPDAIRLCHTDTSITIHDKWPKGMYHALVLPRVLPPYTMHDLADLRTVLALPRAQAHALLLGLKRDALEAKKVIENEMELTHSFAWEIRMGFHALPSVEHLHLHLISSDMIGEAFKTKKHMNSFHPKMGFFLDIDEVLRWFEPDIEPSWFAMVAALDKKTYAPILKEDMRCPICEATHATVPKLRKHLTAHFQKMKDEATERELAKLMAMNYDDPNLLQVAPEPDEPTDAAAEGEGEADAAESSTSTENGLKRKHGEGDGPEVIDVDALPEPPQAKRQQVAAPSDS